MSTDPKLLAILSKRPDYDSELAHHRFLLDAYAGTGGFRGKDRLSTSSWWGWGADAYTDETASLLTRGLDDESHEESYLDRFDREDEAKFRRRVEVAHYANHVANVVDIPLSYFHRKEPSRTLPSGIESWMEDVTGDDEATTWDELRENVIDVRAVVCGYCPVMLWSPGLPEGIDPETFTQAQAEELGVRVRARPLFPANLYDWETDRDGRFSWCKVGIRYTERVDPLGPVEEVEIVSIWRRNDVTEYEIRRRENEEPKLVRETTTRHQWGAVPIVVFRWKALPDDPVRGISAIESAAQMARRHFNYQSELDEHVRRCVFSMLQIPMKDPTKVAEVMGGNGSGLGIPVDATRDAKWISPSPEVAAILEKRLAETRGEIYRQGRLEFTQGTNSGGGGGARSGVSRAFEFETANRSIADFAKRTSRSEQRVFRLLSRVVSSAGMEESKILVVPVEKFSVDDVLAMLEEFQLAIDMDLGQTATVEMKKRVVAAMLPNLDPETLEAIEAELVEVAEEAAKQKEQDREMAKALLDGSKNGKVDENGDPVVDPNDDESIDDENEDA